MRPQEKFWIFRLNGGIEEHINNVFSIGRLDFVNMKKPNGDKGLYSNEFYTWYVFGKYKIRWQKTKRRECS